MWPPSFIVERLSAASRGEITVGTIAVATRQTGVCDVGERGVCYEVYELEARPGYSFIFERGRYDGFSDDEARAALSLTGEVCALLDYRFTNVLQLQRDFQRGVFDVALFGRRDITRNPRLLADLRRDVSAGAGHDCSEWWRADRCLLCDRVRTP